MVTPLDPGLPALDLYFDPSALGELLGREVQVSHLRWKRGVSAVARMHDDDGVSWLAAYSPEAAVKLEKTARRAAEYGLPLERHELGYGVLGAGPVALDPRLYGPLHPFRVAGSGQRDYLRGPGVRVLKYNPFRRVVFSAETTAGTFVGKVRAAVSGTSAEMLDSLASRGVPMLTPVPEARLPSALPLGEQVDYTPWFGDGDLSAVPSQEAGAASYAAGEALSLLHRQPPVLQTDTWRAPARRLRSLISENEVLMPREAARLQRVHSALEPLLRRSGRAATVHGDFSADQVLVKGRDVVEVALIDFERCTYGAAASDLGSFAAVELLEADGAGGADPLALPRTSALLDGYSSGTHAVNESEVLGWTVFFLLNRLHEPFRACAPDWRSQMEDRLAMIESELW